MARHIHACLCGLLIAGSTACGSSKSSGSAGGGTGGTAVGTSGAGGEEPGQVGGQAGATVACPDSEVMCGTECVDLTTNAAHCGACDDPCFAVADCVESECQCPTETTQCAQACVNLTSDPLHCGDCGQLCPAGSSCVAGECTHADGCLGAAKQVTLSRLVFYQSVAIPLMANQIETPNAERNTDIVAGVDGIMRVFVEVDAEWTQRELSARVLLKAAVDQPPLEVFLKRQVFGTSVESDGMSTLNVNIPREWITPTTTYSVELVECAPSAGSELIPRYPDTGDAELRARTVGGLKVYLIPLDIGTQADVPPTQLLEFKKYLEALYPASDVELTLRPAYDAGTFVPTFDDVLDQLRELRSKEAAPHDVYYVGVSPISASDGTDGLAYLAEPADADLRVAVVTNDSDVRYNGAVLAHELGHAHGLPHAPGCDADRPNLAYPYAGSFIGSRGYDRRSYQFLAPNVFYDVMSYCEPAWLSDYNHQFILARIAHVNGVLAHVNAESRRVLSGRTLIVRSTGEATWGRPYRSRMPSRAAESATVLGVDGQPLTTIPVHRLPTSNPHTSHFVVPSAELGWAAVAVPGAPAVSFSAP